MLRKYLLLLLGCLHSLRFPKLGMHIYVASCVLKRPFLWPVSKLSFLAGANHCPNPAFSEAASSPSSSADEFAHGVLL